MIPFRNNLERPQNCYISSKIVEDKYLVVTGISGSKLSVITKRKFLVSAISNAEEQHAEITERLYMIKYYNLVQSVITYAFHGVFFSAFIM